MRSKARRKIEEDKKEREKKEKADRERERARVDPKGWRGKEEGFCNYDGEGGEEGGGTPRVPTVAVEEVISADDDDAAFAEWQASQS